MYMQSCKLLNTPRKTKREAANHNKRQNGRPLTTNIAQCHTPLNIVCGNAGGRTHCTIHERKLFALHSGPEEIALFDPQSATTRLAKRRQRLNAATWAASFSYDFG